MQDLQAQLLEMWDRQSRMIANISRPIDDSSKQFLPLPMVGALRNTWLMFTRSDTGGLLKLRPIWRTTSVKASKKTAKPLWKTSKRSKTSSPKALTPFERL